MVGTIIGRINMKNPTNLRSKGNLCRILSTYSPASNLYSSGLVNPLMPNNLCPLKPKISIPRKVQQYSEMKNVKTKERVRIDLSNISLGMDSCTKITKIKRTVRVANIVRYCFL